jgi:predicted DNA-binding antitoxin AbrB/MazE fold protein
MLDEHIEAVFENGVFRPLGPVDLPEHQRVTLVLPAEVKAFDEDAGYEPLALEQCKTIRVRLKRVGECGPVPYPVGEAPLPQEPFLTEEICAPCSIPWPEGKPARAVRVDAPLPAAHDLPMED